MWYYYNTKVKILYYHNVAICWVLPYHILQFFFFLYSTVNHFPKVKLCQHHLFCLPRVIRCLKPSRELKSQLIFIILLPKKISLYMKHLLRIYEIRYQYLVSINQYNIVLQNIAILHCIDFWLVRDWLTDWLSKFTEHSLSEELQEDPTHCVRSSRSSSGLLDNTCVPLELLHSQSVCC